MILHLGRPTSGDIDFYKRWETIAPVLKTTPIDGSSVTIIVVDFRTEVTDSFLKRYPNCKYVCSPTTGHTHLKSAFKGIKLVTLKGENEFLSSIRSVSEFTIKQMLALSRPSGQGNLLYRKNLSIIGYGRIGKQVAGLALAFGMSIRIFDKNNTKQDLEELFTIGDFITIHLDENPTTDGIINSKLISLMKPTSYLINTSRPSIVDEDALVRALNNKSIAGAAVDFPIRQPCYGNLFVSPHIAGCTLEDRIATDKFIISKLTAMIQ